MMDGMIRRFSSMLLAAAAAAGLSAGPAFAQVTPGGPTVGPAGGVASTTAPSNSEGTPAGGTGVIGATRVGPSSTASTGTSVAPPRHHARRVRHRAHRAARPATTDTNSAAGLNGSEAPSR
jgi:hypothetical protein